MRRGTSVARLLIFTALITTGAVRANAQQPGPQPLPGPSQHPDFLTGADYQMSGVALASDDKRFSWDAHFGGTVDVIDYLFGRASIVADYEAVLGDELRIFDPNQGNYILETSASVWAGRTEFAGVFHHVSRHLGDRPKDFAIAWNVAGVRVLRQIKVNNTTLLIRAGAGRVIQHSGGIDYRSTADFDVSVRHPVNTRVSAYARSFGEVIGVDQSATIHRGTQRSGRIEGGIRINGKGGALELFAGFERRLDASQIDKLPLSWGLAGLRLVSK
jgi:hypothetical protein